MKRQQEGQEVAEQQGRQLRKADSHPEAPARKSSKEVEEKEREEEAAARQVEEQKKGMVPSDMQGAPDWAVALWNKMGEVGSKVDGASCKAEEAVTEARAAKQEAAEAKKEVEKLKETSMTKKEAVDLIKQEVTKASGERAWPTPSEGGGSTSAWKKSKGESKGKSEGNEKEEEDEEEEEDTKAIEMVIGGFRFNTPSVDIKEYIEVIMNMGEPAFKHKGVRTTRKMTSYGIIRFVSMKEKMRFKKFLASLQEPLEKDGKKLRIGENEDKEVRTRGRTIAKVVKALYDAKEGRQDIKRDYVIHEVYKKEGKIWKRVAYYQDGSLKLKGEALELKEKIQKLVDEKRKSEDDSE